MATRFGALPPLNQVEAQHPRLQVSSNEESSDSDSPSKNPCKVRTTLEKNVKRYRNDPYRAPVIQVPSVEVESDDEQYDNNYHQPNSFYHGHNGNSFNSQQQQHPQPPSNYHGSSFQRHGGSFNSNATPEVSTYDSDGDGGFTLQAPQQLGHHTASNGSMTSQSKLAPVRAFGKRLPSIGRVDPLVQALAQAPPKTDNTKRNGGSFRQEQFSRTSSHSNNPTPPPVVPQQCHAMIKFKHSKSAYLYDPNTIDLTSGDTVVTEADRGEDIGTVVNPRHEPKQPSEKTCRILRHANRDDTEHLVTVRQQEVDALIYCREAVKMAGLGEEMSIVDCEFQADFKKLTVFFAGRKNKRQVDFRELQRHLYRHFRCRIWISNW